MSKIENLFTRLLLLSVLGICVSCYLVYHHENIVGGYNVGQSFCNIGGHFNCDDVARSKYSSLFGIPVACFGLVYFLIVFSVSFFIKEKNENALRFIGVGSYLALIPSLILFAISAIQIQKFCLFCILLDLIILCIVVLTHAYVKIFTYADIEDFFKSLKIYFYLSAPVIIVFSFVLPWMFRNFILESAVKEAVIKNIYNSWNESPAIDLALNLTGDSMQKDFYLGTDTAKLTLVEFSDFECPFCMLAAKQVKKIAARWPNEVRVVFKNFPLDKMCNLRFEQAPHQFACQAAVMARCAGQEAESNFWQFHDRLFAIEDWSLENLIKVSNDFNALQIDSCLKEGSALSRVRADSELGNQIGINSTPSFFINNKRVVINRLDQLEKLVEMILSK